MLSIEWTNVHLAGAFIIGAIFATIVTLRIVRFVVDYFTSLESKRMKRRRLSAQDDTRRPYDQDNE